MSDSKDREFEHLASQSGLAPDNHGANPELPPRDNFPCGEAQSRSPSISSGSAGPVQESQRLVVLDVLRGIALFGILMVNMPTFALPFMQALGHASLGEEALSERLAASFVKWFFEYKFISLFSLLFGVGFILQISRAESRGETFVWRYLRRSLVLAALGLAHGIGLWYGDILFVYAIAGLLLLPLSRLSPRTLMILSVVALAITALVATGLATLEYVVNRMGGEQLEAQVAEATEKIASGEAPRGWNALMAAKFDPSHPYWLHGEMQAYRDGPLIDALIFRAAMFGFGLIAAALGFGWHVVAMFMLGAALMKLDFFAANNGAWHRRLVYVALPLGLVTEGAFVAAQWLNNFETTIGMVLLHPLREVGSVSLMLGYVGLVCCGMHNQRLVRLSRPLADTGRMALTVYLSCTLLATSLMYWWGLAWFGSLSRVELIGCVFGLYAVMVLFSVLWMKWFHYGPMEWLWRTLTYLTPPRLIRS